MADAEANIDLPDTLVIGQRLSDEFDNILLQGWTTPDTAKTFAERVQVAVAQLKYMTERFRQPIGD